MKRLTLSPLIARASGGAKTLAEIVGTTVLVMLIMAPDAAAQQATAPLDAEREIIQQLLRRIEQLEARIKELEAQAATTASPPPASVTPEAEVTRQEVEDQPRRETHQHEEVSTGVPRLQIRGFADVGVHASDLKGATTSFALGQLDLFITSQLSDTLSVLGELVFEAGEDRAFAPDFERILLQYSPNDYFNLGIGRYHTAIGYYNTAYHHGSWFETATGRPFLFAFEDEGGILPIHGVGVTLSGRIPSGRLGLRYVAEVSNGRASRSPLDEPVQNARDENNGKAFNLALFMRPDWAPGLQAGFSVYRDRLTPDGMPKIGQTILATHFVYQGLTLEWLNEALVVRHTPRGLGQTFNTPGFYTQIAPRFGRLRPYFRYQYVNAHESEPIFSDVGLRHGPSVGLRYDFSEFAAFKVQYDHTRRRGLNSINGLELQFAFTF